MVRESWLAGTLAGVGVCAMFLVVSQLAHDSRVELMDDSLPASYQQSVHDLSAVDTRRGRHPSLKDTAFLAQLSTVLSARHGSNVDSKPLSKELSRTQSLEEHDLSVRQTKANARTMSLSDTSGAKWCHCVEGEGCECAHDSGSLRRKGAKAVSLAMDCCQCDGSSVNLPGAPCQDCHECGSKAFSPFYNPYGVRKSAHAQRKTPILAQQKGRVWSAKGGQEQFWKDGEEKGGVGDGMRTLNKIISHAKHFVRPPPTKDEYKIIKKTVIHKDPLVAAS
mmetsp:Transcript_988/g.2172  ORF Transcript_988/g.2172 Transcript_988/m.2172 type:complete len:278 (-) Transcript_988:141-974(-)|eukprot:2504714-Rhodomonas_salina.7